MKNKLLTFTVYFIPLIAIMFLVLWHIDVNYYPKIFGDEYGYWAAGAYFSGFDWNDITALNDYYGWGYGMILALFLSLPISPKVCYILAIALNGIILWGIYLIYYKFAENLFPNESKLLCSIIAMACAIMPSSLLYSQFTMAEIILEFVYCLLMYELWLLLQKFDARRIAIIALLNIWLISIHLRTIGIVAISAISVICIFYSLPSKKIRRLVLFFSVLALGFLISNCIKTTFQQHIALDFVQLKTGNTASGQLSKFQQLVSPEGVQSVLANLSGRIFSLIINSYLLVLVTIFAGVFEFVNGVKKKQISKVSKLSVICIVNTLSLVAISALYMIGTTTARFDILTYCRYHEFSTGMLFLLGLYYLSRYVHDSKSNKILAVIVISTFVLCKIVSMEMNYDSSTSNLFICNPRLFFIYRNVSNSRDIYFLLFLISLVVFLMLYILFKSGALRAFTVVICFLIVMNIYESDCVFKDGTLVWSNSLFQETDDMVEFINSNDYNQSLCFLTDDDVLKVDLLRFVMKNDRIVVVDDEHLSSMMTDGNILITTVSYNGEANLEDYEIIYEADNLYLWRAITNE